MIEGLFGALICSGLIWLILFIWSLVHLFKRTDIELNSKLLWVLILLFFPFVGIAIYCFANIKVAKTLFIFTCIGVIISISTSFYLVYNKPHRDVSKEKGLELTAQKIYDEFKANEEAANQKYLDKAIQLSGEVATVSTNQDGNVVADFKTNDSLFVINCTFKTNPGPIKPGDHITFKGICTGYIPDANVVINEGVLVK